MRGGGYLVILAGVTVLAAGCGTEVAQPVNLAAAVTRTAGQTARVAVTATMQAPDMSVSFTATGVFDFARSRGTLSMQDPVAMTEIFIPPKAYVKIPGGAYGPLPRGKSWIAVDAGTSGDLGSSPLGPFAGGADPADLLASLTAISSSVTDLGATTIRGVPVTGFRVNIDPAKAAARVPRQERASFRGFAGSLGPGVIPVDVWVDSQNLVRRVQLTLRVQGGMGAPGRARFVLTIDFYDFGVPVRVSAPPAAQVASVPQLGGGSSGSIGIGPSPSPPPVSGALSPVQKAAAEQAVRAFWSALGHNDPAAVARTVPSAQRSCVRSLLSGGPEITVTSLRIVSAQPAGNDTATVRFTVKAHADLGGQDVPVFPQGPDGVQWLVTTETVGHWYVDLGRSTAFMLGGACT